MVRHFCVYLVASKVPRERQHRGPLSRVLVPTSFQHLPHTFADPRIVLAQWSTAMYNRVNNGGVAMQPIEWHFPCEYLDECTYVH
jgi:hypothetical protein